MNFSDLRLTEPILRAVARQGYDTPTPIQAETIPPTLKGRDVLGSAQTGTGKTAAFALPVLDRLAASSPRAGASKPSKRPRCLVLCPTRELANQIGDSFATYGEHLKLRHTVIFGGVSQRPQVGALRRGVETLIATPGRLLDLMEQGHVDLSGVETLILDEADRMLDMGFIKDIERIVERVPAGRQTLLFSATMPPAIHRLANKLLEDPATIQLATKTPAAERIEQSVYFVQHRDKGRLMAHLVEELGLSRALVFTRTKHGADRLVKHLRKEGTAADAIHGNKTQNARQKALKGFRDGRTPILVATDVASRGIDVDGITHVINYDLTHEPETYVHRIGRTARAGTSGAALSFCDADERQNLRGVERLIRQKITVQTDHPYHAESVRARTNGSPKPDPGRKTQQSAGGRRMGKPAHAKRNPRRASTNDASSANRRRGGNGRRNRRSGRPAA